MRTHELPDVLDIERLCFDFAWDEEDFLCCLRQHNCIGLVAERYDEIVGYMIYEIEKGRLRLLSIAVHPEHQRNNVGTQMINRLKDKLSQQRRRAIVVDVCEDNLEAHLFFRAVEFHAKRVLRDYWPDGGDAYRFQYLVGSESVTTFNRIAKF